MKPFDELSESEKRLRRVQWITEMELTHSKAQIANVKNRIKSIFEQTGSECPDLIAATALLLMLNG